jgi:hypothetical protein
MERGNPYHFIAQYDSYQGIALAMPKAAPSGCAFRRFGGGSSSYCELADE